MTTNRMVLEQTPSDERLEYLAKGQYFFARGAYEEAQAMARELLAYRTASKEAVAWTTGTYSQNIGCNFGERQPGEAPCIAAVYWDHKTFRHHTDCDETSDRWLQEAIRNTRAKPLYAEPPLHAVPSSSVREECYRLQLLNIMQDLELPKNSSFVDIISEIDRLRTLQAVTVPDEPTDDERLMEIEGVSVVKLPTEFHSEHGVVVQLEKVMAALAVHGIKYERRHQKVVGLRAGIDAVRAEGIDIDAEKINAEKCHK